MPIVDSATGWQEATVLIDGHELTVAQAMSVRVAVSSFRIQLGDPAFRAGLGPTLADNYDAHLATVEDLLIDCGRK